MAKMHLSLLVLAAVGCCFLMDPATAMIHIVGGAHGWRLPHNKTFFEQWAKPRTFGVGDKIGQFLLIYMLVFVFLGISPLIFYTARKFDMNSI